MSTRNFDPTRAVEIISSRYGSGYRIGGRLVLTSAHLFPHSSNISCKVRSKQTFGVTAARVVWIASGADIALVELPEKIPGCTPVVLGKLPKNSGEIVDFDLYGWPRWAQTEHSGETPKAGGRHIIGQIYLSDYSPDGLLVIEPQRLPSWAPSPEKNRSEWEGISGAAVICNGLVIAVQRHHQNLARPASLEAEPLSKIVDDEQWSSLLWKHGIAPDTETLEASVKSGKLINVPEFPPYFLPRTEELQILKDLVLTEINPTVVVTGTTCKIGVQGMGGIGKSVLAAALAHDTEVRQAFSDGILWVTLGQHPTLTARQYQVAKYVHSDLQPFVDEQDGKAELSRLFADKACLLIVDDVWELEHAEAFTALGPECKLLFTTRNGEITSALEAEQYSLKVLTDQQALQLLAKSADQDVETLPEEAKKVAEECGNLPLALAIAGAMVARKPHLWNGILHRFQQTDLEKIKRKFPNYPYQNLLIAMQVSVDDLEPDLQERYLDFSVFPEDVLIPMAVLQTFWGALGMDELDVELLVENLVNRFLVIQVDKDRLRLHDLLLDYICKQVGDISSLHNRILNAYWEKCQGDWAKGPRNDGYFFYQIATHLKKSGRNKELYDLLINFDWIKTKLEVTDINNLIADYDLLSEESIALIKEALRLSAKYVSLNNSLLAGQLLGRLDTGFSDSVDSLLRQAISWNKETWIRPLRPCLSMAGGALARILDGHTREVKSLAITEDGKRAISASLDCTLKVWDLDQGVALFVLQGHEQEIYSVSMTPDGRLAISGSTDGIIKIWDLVSGTEKYSFKGHTELVWSTAITPNGRIALSTSDDFTLRVWDLIHGKEVKTLALYQNQIWEYKSLPSSAKLSLPNDDVITSVAITPDAQTAVIGTYKGSIKILSLSQGRELCSLLSSYGYKLNVAISQDAQKIVSASRSSQEYSLNLWENIDQGIQRFNYSHRVIYCHSGLVSSIAITSDGQRIVSISNDRSLRLIDLSEEQDLVKNFELKGDSPTSLAINKNGLRGISGSRNGEIKVWNLNRNRKNESSKIHSERIWSVTLTPDGKRAISASHDCTLKVCDVSTMKALFSLEGHSEGVQSVRVRSDGDHVISVSRDSTIRLWSLKQKSELYKIQLNEFYIWSVAVTKDGSKAVLTTYNHNNLETANSLQIWDLEKGEALYKFVDNGTRDYDHTMYAVAITPDGKKIMSSGPNYSIRVWDFKLECITTTVNTHREPVRAITLTNDGQRMISASDDCRLKVWDLAEEKVTCSHDLVGHTDNVWSVAVTSDGQYAVSTSFDNTMKLWRVSSGTVIATYHTESPLLSCEITPDDRTIVAGDLDGRLHFYSIEST